MKRVVSLGEILLRLSPPQYQTLTQATSLDCQFGGSELNVLSTLAQLGHKVSLISAIPDNDLGRMTKTFLFSRQISQTYILEKGKRLGIYYYQKGFSLRASRVTYDRDYSAFWESKLEDYDLEHVFDGVDWFHVSGITPALTDDLYRLTYYLMTRAKKEGLTISFDLNFRASLWESFQEARDLLSPLVMLADVCIGIEPLTLVGEGQEDLKDQLGLSRPYEDQALLRTILAKLATVYGVRSFAFTQREMGHTNEYLLKGYLYQNGQLYQTGKSGIQVLDRVGTGDAFTAGLIHGMLQKEMPEKILAIAMASFKFKHTIEGDSNCITQADIDHLLDEESHEIKR
ncbi:PfkB family carbohydrate kinase [Streptococcus castoreus]|uniref:sugar kinase n=1 Tax=Streptococcus castoreus TaxID=254786 RepID=UPI0004809D7A|nr:sugar kinase [Streptococcus castoreus]